MLYGIQRELVRRPIAAGVAGAQQRAALLGWLSLLVASFPGAPNRESMRRLQRRVSLQLARGEALGTSEWTGVLEDVPKPILPLSGGGRVRGWGSGAGGRGRGMGVDACSASG